MALYLNIKEVCYPLYTAVDYSLYCNLVMDHNCHCVCSTFQGCPHKAHMFISYIILHFLQLIHSGYVFKNLVDKHIF